MVCIMGMKARKKLSVALVIREPERTSVLTLTSTIGEKMYGVGYAKAVSYTHLTLPTIYSV